MKVSIVCIGAFLLQLCAASVQLKLTVRSFTGGHWYCASTSGGSRDRLGSGPCTSLVDRGTDYSSFQFGSCDGILSDSCPPISKTGVAITSPSITNYPINHPDFEGIYGDGSAALNIVKTVLGSDRKPVFGGIGAQSALNSFRVSSNYDFQDWFRDSVRNKRIDGIAITLQPTSVGASTFTFAQLNFFPLNAYVASAGGVGGSANNHNGVNPPNYNAAIWPLASYEQCLFCPEFTLNGVTMYSKFSFTVEHHSFFQYQGNEVFQFTGDDDLWVFIDDQLVIDLGGTHGSLSASISLNNLPNNVMLTVGQVYSFDLFYCERHTTQSSLQLTTSITQLCSVVDLSYTFFSSTNLQQTISASPSLLMITGDPIPASDTGIHFGITSPAIVSLNQMYQLQSGFIFSFAVTVVPTNPSTNGLGTFSVQLKPTLTSGVTLSIDFLSTGIIRATLPTSGVTKSITLNSWLQPIFNGRLHQIQVVYYNQPDWIQVFVDDMVNPVLKIKNVNLATELNTSGGGFIQLNFQNYISQPAWVNIGITSIQMQLTSLDKTKTTLVATPTSYPAGGLQKITIQSFDQCGNLLKSGGLLNQFAATLQGTNTSAGVGIDNGDGTYSFTWNVTKVGMYSPQLFSVASRGVVTPLPLVNSPTIPPVSVTLAALNVDSVNTTIRNSNNTFGGSLSQDLSFSLFVTDMYGNLPDRSSGANLITATIRNQNQTVGYAAQSRIQVTFNTSTNLFDVVYSATTAGAYIITLTAIDTGKVIFSVNGVIIGTMDGENHEQPTIINILDTKYAMYIGMVLVALLPCFAYIGCRLLRYRRKHRERNARELLAEDVPVTKGETAIANPAFDHGVPGDKVAYQKALQKLESQMEEQEKWTSQKIQKLETLDTMKKEIDNLTAIKR